MLSSMNIGGVEKSFLSLISTMQKEKFDITLLLLEKRGGFLNHVPEWITIKEVGWYAQIKPIIMQPPQKTILNYVERKEIGKIPIFAFKYYVSKKLNNRYIYYEHVLKELPHLEENFDVAISYQGPTDIIDFYVANNISAKKKISWVHFDVEKHQINQRLYKELYKKFDAVYVVSKEARRKLIKFFPEIRTKTEVYKNNVSFDLIKKMSEEIVEFDEHYNGIKICTVGRLSYEKGQDIAIYALSELIKDGHNVKWYCIGEGKERRFYEELISELNLRENFILLGAKENPYPYIKKADIYVQTSRHEGFCLSLAEAKCLQKPIVTTDFTGAREQIEHGVNGWIVKPNSTELCEQIKKLLGNLANGVKISSNIDPLNIEITQEVGRFINW